MQSGMNLDLLVHPDYDVQTQALRIPMKSITLLLFASFFVLVASAQEDPTKTLDRLKRSYEATLVKAIVPIQQEYIRSLVELQQYHVTAGDLDSALHVREAIRLAETWKDFPINRLSDHSKYLRKKINGMTASFEGRCGFVKLRFHSQYVLYVHENQERKLHYSVTGDKSLTIHGGEEGYDVSFSSNFQSGSLRSKLGEYPLVIPGESRGLGNRESHEANAAHESGQK